MKTLQIYKGVIAFIALQIVALGIVAAYPPLVNYLPNRELAESAAVTDAISAAKMLDLTALPEDLAEMVTEGVDSADNAVDALGTVSAAAQAVVDGAEAYRPQHTEVRALEKRIRWLEEHHGDAAEIEALRALIPAEWEQVHSDFAKFTKAETDARNAYRRAADAAFEGPAEVLAVLQARAAYEALADPLAGIRPVFETGEGDEAVDQVKALESLIGDVAGAGEVKKILSKARRALDKDKREEALELYQQALDAYDAQLEWRADAERVIPGLTAYLEGIRGTLGVRVQDRLTREQALAMASCTAHHRDVSLNF